VAALTSGIFSFESNDEEEFLAIDEGILVIVQNQTFITYLVVIHNACLDLSKFLSKNI
jgi:F0F1-type ATP synthase epsilon subunit